MTTERERRYRYGPGAPCVDEIERDAKEKQERIRGQGSATPGPWEAFQELAAAGKRLLAIIEDEEERTERAIPADPGCIGCTSGTTPNRLNTGLCGRHAMQAALRKAGRE